jgi:hypothetical protein
MLASAFTIYLSDTNETMRENKLREWKNILGNPSFNFIKFMSTESAIL